MKKIYYYSLLLATCSCSPAHQVVFKDQRIDLEVITFDETIAELSGVNQKLELSVI